MNKRVGTIVIKHYLDLGDTITDTRVEIERVRFSEIEGERCEAYNRTGIFYPYPSSLARLMRVMSGMPAFPTPEKCGWKSGMSYAETYKTGCDVSTAIELRGDCSDYKFCPYCGRKIEVVK